MSTLIGSSFVALHSQHTLQYADWLAVYTLAKDEGVGEHLDSYDCENFLGLAVYLFITTQSQGTREQLSRLLPKFGSAIVLPLLKILYRKEIFVEQNIPMLAQQSLNEMAPYPLMIGLNQVLDLNLQDALKTVALQMVQQLLQSCEPSVYVVLSQLLSETNRHLVSEFSMSQLLDHASSRGRCQHDERGANIAVLKRKVVQCV
ncbi:hypothetical protein N836_02310 [Leptolyngbya sp. Heron Island J]|uniref:hypothetical protein n=1 Tax=Leptolyngbya sp. Heron Island J TaxID=1385935 RepID=UPI0003B954E9|nr:hypothetical protein [Leptolyngbya sp. Heron Island J]ESA38354.1 hypothetical protein N836_02310 [Leptolyngbya sp. Heron Island J]